MNLRLPALKRFRITAITFVVLVLGFLLYLFEFVEGKKAYLNERAFRVLGQIGENIEAKYHNTLTNARLEIAKRVTIAGELANEKGLYNKQLEFKRSLRFNPEAEPTTTKWPLLYFQRVNDQWRLFTQDTVSDRNINLNPNELPHIASIEFEFNTRLADFINPLLTPQVFDQYVLLQPDTGMQKDPARVSYHIIYEDFTSDLRLTQLGDSIANHVLDVVAGGVPYKLFAHPVSIGNTDGFVLCGLIKAKRYRADIYAVPMLTVILIISVLGLLALGYPFLKLLIMSEWERLRAVDAFFTVASLIVGAFLTTLLLFSLYGHHFPDTDATDDDLKVLAGDIEGSLGKELQAVARQLQAYRELIPEDSLLAGRNNLLNNKNDKRYPGYYPYLVDVFWVDTTGHAREMWTTETNTSPYVDVSDREYYKAFVQHRPWSMPLAGEPGGSFQYMLTPIFDRISGRNLAIISTNYPKRHLEWEQGDTSRRQKTNQYAVMALETELHSVINPILPLGYSFCVLDKAGTVWFHSDRRKNLQEKFLKECEDNTVLISALEGDAQAYLHLSYNGQPYRAYITPIKTMPLHLVVFRDDNYSKTTSVLTITLAFLSYILSMLPLCVLIVVHKLSQRQDSRLRGENSAFSWLRPREKNVIAFVKLTYAFGALLLLNCATLPFISNYSFVITFHSLTAVYAFGMAQLLICYPADQPFRPSEVRFLVPVIVVVFLINFVAAIAFNQPGWSGQYILLLIYQLGCIAVVVMIVTAKSGHSLQNYPKLAMTAPLPATYMRFLTLWVLVIGVLPAVSLYRVAYNHEHQIASRHYLLDMAQNLRQRKYAIEEKYRQLEVNQANTIQDSLLRSKGRYTLASFAPDTSLVWFCQGAECTNAAGKKTIPPVSSKAMSAGFADADAFGHWLRNGFLYNPIVVNNQHLGYYLDAVPDKQDTRQNVFLTSENKGALWYRTFNLTQPESEYLYLKTDFPHLMSRWLTRPYQLLVFLLVWLVLLYALYSLGKYAIFRLFNLELYEKYRQLPDSMDVVAQMLLDREHGQSVFLTGLYLAGHSSFLDKFERTYQKQVRQIDFRTFDARFKKLQAVVQEGPELKVLVLKYFEKVIYWQPAEVLSLQDDMEELLRLNQVRLLIVSQKTPCEFLRCFTGLHAKEEEGDLSLIQARWHTLFSTFNQQNYHLSMRFNGLRKVKIAVPGTDDAAVPHAVPPNSPLKYVNGVQYVAWVRKTTEYFSKLLREATASQDTQSS